MYLYIYLLSSSFFFYFNNCFWYSKSDKTDVFSAYARHRQLFLNEL